MRESTRVASGSGSASRESVRALHLDREEEHRLALRARSGDVVARNVLFDHNLPIVVTFVRKLRLGTVRYEDVIQEGNLGLLRALETFDPGAGTRVATYAIWWIRAYVVRYLKEARSIVRPRGGALALADLSLDAPLDDENGGSRVERVEDDRPGPEDAFLSTEAEVEVRELLTRVRERIGELGWDLVHSRMQHEEPETLEAVGARWGLSRERVRQVEVKTKRLLATLLDGGPREAA